jgi:hypothetical protein
LKVQRFIEKLAWNMPCTVFLFPNFLHSVFFLIVLPFSLCSDHFNPE